MVGTSSLWQRKGVTLFAVSFWILVAVYICTFTMNAWVCDDAYITFRTVDNFINGYGLTWNVDERVQAYTHPLWMLLVSLCYLLTSDVFYTSIAISFALCLSSLFIVHHSLRKRAGTELWKSSLLIIVLLSSKSVLDYTTSGLENALSYFLATLFLIIFLFQQKVPKDFSRGETASLFLIAALAVTNRQDTLLLYIPALAYVIAVQIKKLKWQLATVILMASLPALGWLLLSLIYYGFPFPNTAYAKTLCTGIPVSWKIERGLEYLTNSLRWDTASHLFLVLAAVLSATARSKRSLFILSGVLLYLGFTVILGASATHQSGRFLAVPFYITSLVLIYQIKRPLLALGLAVLLIVYLAASPVSSVKMGTRFYKPYKQGMSCIDTNYFVHQEGAALIDWRPGRELPDHPWYHYGKNFRNSPNRIHIGGALHSAAIGYFGYAAGPGKCIIDPVGISDPLLARLPAIMPDRYEAWVSGHTKRMIPAGYPRSVAYNENLIEDPEIHRFYDRIRMITRGRIFDTERLKEIWRMNTGSCYHPTASNPSQPDS
jgi:arabinofuranosyltransferase